MYVQIFKLAFTILQIIYHIFYKSIVFCISDESGGVMAEFN